ncbi:MAG TPA: alanine--tRNA ligase, partial [Verrucomicrobia bacterium]|nr:alanine--tRNA ligase [Verrucomicrobiota bacterium]
PCSFSPARAADTQKCIRAGGKHNDLEDVGLDTYHHTFFEMLGNWSFGDYFKKEAIEWSWELITKVWKFPKERMFATVYRPDKSQGDPSEADEEAYEFWKIIFEREGLDPEQHIVFGNKKDNFWMMGETGPCGPCSELHMDLTPDADSRGKLVNMDDPRCIEIWNLVFIQLNATADGSFGPLPARHVDTGMGFERVTAIIQGSKNFTDFSSIISNYHTDIFQPLFDALEKASGFKYQGTVPKPGSSGETSQEKTDIAFRVIADHIRTLSFSIADGIEPGNTDRNYVLRRILRRAVRYGRTLDLHDTFFYKLAEVVCDSMGDIFPEIRNRIDRIREVLKTEEESFNKTLDRGIELFGEEKERCLAAGTKRLTGDFTFKLYDTYGFPKDLTQLMARETGFEVDLDGFERLMEQQRERARSSRKTQEIKVEDIGSFAATQFVGFESVSSSGSVLEVIKDANDYYGVILDVSPFYAEMGGQVGDSGKLIVGGEEFRILNTRKIGETFIHDLDGQPSFSVEDTVEAKVDNMRRKAIERHHTVTHLLHWALHEVIGDSVKQKGSYVGPDKLTFDFNHSGVSTSDLQDIQRLVNERILENTTISWQTVPYADVRNNPDLMQIFGEKYGEEVRVIQIGGEPGKLNGYSMELCGGTHTSATGEIGGFRILSESAVAAGIRRIEAVCGMQAYEVGCQETELIKTLSHRIHCPTTELDKKVVALVEQHKALEKNIKTLQKSQAESIAKHLIQQVAESEKPGVICSNLGEIEAKLFQTVVEVLKKDQKGVALLGGFSGDNVLLGALVNSEYIRMIQAGKIIQTIAPIVGGKGGGRPEMARGGGKLPGKLDEALEKGLDWIRGAVNP